MAYRRFFGEPPGSYKRDWREVLPRGEWALCRYDTSHRYVDGTKGLVLTRKQGGWQTWSAVTRIRQLVGARC